MSLDGALEVSVFLQNFHNLDLFQQGWYGIKVTCFWEDEMAPFRVGRPSRVVQYAAPNVSGGESMASWKLDDEDNSYRSRPFKVRYFHQDINLQELVSFKLTISDYILSLEASESSIIIRFDLVFASISKETLPGVPPADMASISSHEFRIVGMAWLGLHTFCPLTFDPHHLIFLDANVHTVLLHFSNNKLPGQLASSHGLKQGEGNSIPQETTGNKGDQVSSEQSTTPPAPTFEEIHLVHLLAISAEKLFQEMQRLIAACDAYSVEVPILQVTEASQKRETAMKLWLEGRFSSEIQSPGGRPPISWQEWQTEREDIAAYLSRLWNKFLTLHRNHHVHVVRLLRLSWDSHRQMEASQWTVGTEVDMHEEDMFGVGSHDVSELWKASLPNQSQDQRATTSAYRAQLYRTHLVNSKSRHIPFQDLRYFKDPAIQPILFGRVHRSRGNDRPNFMAADCKAMQQEGTHVVVFVHGFQGHHLDLRLMRDHLTIMDPSIVSLMADSNEENTLDSLQDMGLRLAKEVSKFLQSMGDPRNPKSRQLPLNRLSFVGHSIGNLIIRAAVAETIMKPYVQYLHSYVSLSGPHLGYLFNSNNWFNGGLWVLKQVKSLTVMSQLSFADHPNLQQCFLYKLNQASFFQHFTHVVLVASPQDGYVPYHSARIELCPAAMRDQKLGVAYAEMVHACLEPLLVAGKTHQKTFLRCDVNFEKEGQVRAIDSLVGRTAHIQLLENDIYVRFLIWHYREFFV